MLKLKVLSDCHVNITVQGVTLVEFTLSDMPVLVYFDSVALVATGDRSGSLLAVVMERHEDLIYTEFTQDSTPLLCLL